MATPFISILLPVRGETDELAECLVSIANQTYPRDRFEVLVADGSDPPVDPSTLPAGIDVRVLPNLERLMSRGVDMAAAHARGDYLAIVSAHSTLPPDYLARMAETARATGAANVGVRIKKVARTRWGQAIAAATSSRLGVGASIQHYGEAAGWVDSAFPGFIERERFEALGGYDPRLAANSDDEFNARLRAAGGRVWYEPEVDVAYRPRETIAGVFRQYYRYGRWKVAVARTGVSGYIRPRHVVPSLAVLGAAFVPLAVAARRAVAIPALAVLGAYGLLAWTEGRRLSRLRRVSAWRTAVVFPIIHSGYGLGFLRGLLDEGLPDEGQGPPGPSALDSRRLARMGTVEYRSLEAGDVPAAAALHRDVFSDHFLGHMGQRFLERFYEQFVSRPGNYGMVAESDGQVVGAVVGSTDPARLYSDFYRAHFVELARLYGIRLLLDGYIRSHSAARIPHVARAIQSRLGLRRRAPSDPDGRPSARLLSIGVTELLRGRGIAEGLTERFCRRLADDGVGAVGLTVLNGNVRAIRFYERTGWTRGGVDAAATAFWRELEPSSGPRSGPSAPGVDAGSGALPHG